MYLFGFGNEQLHEGDLSVIAHSGWVSLAFINKINEPNTWGDSSFETIEMYGWYSIDQEGKIKGRRKDGLLSIVLKQHPAWHKNRFFPLPSVMINSPIVRLFSESVKAKGYNFPILDQL